MRRLPEPSASKIWSWVLCDWEPRITVLARISSNLAGSQVVRQWQWVSEWVRCNRVTPSKGGMTSSNDTPFVVEEKVQFQNTKEQDCGHGSRYQERLCWRGPTAVYWTGPVCNGIIMFVSGCGYIRTRRWCQPRCDMYRAAYPPHKHHHVTLSTLQPAVLVVKENMEALSLSS
jgi:hypothetical protein